MNASAVPPGLTRVDLHLHSRASTDTGSWFVRRAGVPESHTEPRDAYSAAKRRGMDLVALTDHNTISGALEIARLIMGAFSTTTPLAICSSTSDCSETESRKSTILAFS